MNKKRKPVVPVSKKQNKDKFWLSGIIILVIIAYFPVFNGQLTNFDDIVYITGNPYIQFFNIESLWKFFSEYYYGGYYPLTLFSLSADYSLLGLSPELYHITNLLLHIMNTLLLYILLKQLFHERNIILIATLIFGIHTLHVESVAWVSERKDVLFSFFFLLSLIFYTFYIKDKKKHAIYISFLFFLLSLLAKTTAVSLALSLFIIDYILKENLFYKKAFWVKIPFLLTAFGFGIIAIKAQESIGAITEEATLSIFERIHYASYAFTMYIVKSLIPFKLSAFYPYPDNQYTLPLSYYLFPLISTGIFVYLLLKWKKNPFVNFLILFYAINIVFLLQIIQVNNFIMADRFMYIPLISYCLFAAYIFVQVQKKYPSAKKTLQTLGLFYILFLLVSTNIRSTIWKDSITLWNDVISKYPEVHKAYGHRGMALADVGRYEEAIRDFNKSIELDSTYVFAYLHKGFAYGDLGKLDKAIEVFDEAIALKDDYPASYLNRGTIKARAGDLQGAIWDFRKAIALNPKHYQAFNNIGLALANTGKYAEAIPFYDIAIRIEKNYYPAYNNRGFAKVNLKDFSGAIKDYNASIKIAPEDYMSYWYRGLAYASQNNLEAAENDLDKVLELYAHFPEAYYNRALIKLRSNKRYSACDDLQRAYNLGYERAVYTMRQYCK
jgi:protein O-mannosyl-transferase